MNIQNRKLFQLLRYKLLNNLISIEFESFQRWTNVHLFNLVSEKICEMNF